MTIFTRLRCLRGHAVLELTRSPVQVKFWAMFAEGADVILTRVTGRLEHRTCSRCGHETPKQWVGLKEYKTNLTGITYNDVGGRLKQGGA